MVFLSPFFGCWNSQIGIILTCTRRLLTVLHKALFIFVFRFVGVQRRPAPEPLTVLCCARKKRNKNVKRTLHYFDILYKLFVCSKLINFFALRFILFFCFLLLFVCSTLKAMKHGVISIFTLFNGNRE